MIGKSEGTKGLNLWCRGDRNWQPWPKGENPMFLSWSCRERLLSGTLRATDFGLAPNG